MAEDIAPALLEQLRAAFLENLENDKTAARLLEEIQNGTANYEIAGNYAEQVGTALADAFSAVLTADALPDGKMYWNIADRVVRPLLEQDYELVSNAAVQVQTALNQAAGIGIKAQKAALNTDRVDGLLNKICSKDNYDEVAWALNDPVKNFSRSVVDETAKTNAAFQAKSGMSPRIIRTAEHKCCEWCSGLEGTYDYRNDDLPDDIYRRHENCRCTVELDEGGVRRQNVWTKKWTSAGETDTIEQRKQIGLSNSDAFRASDYDATVKSFVSTDRDALVSAAKNGTRHAGVYKDANAKTKNQLQKSIVSRTSQVERHADKIKNPETYIVDWANKSQRYQSGLLRKWEKDMKRNAEQAEIEIAVFESRFGK